MTTGGLQPSLFAASADVPADPAQFMREALGTRRERRELPGGAWVDLVTDFIPAPDSLFARLLTDVAWEAERREMFSQLVDVPRLHRFHSHRDELPNPGLYMVRDVLNEHYASTPNESLVTLGACLYRHERDSVAWHADDAGKAKRVDTCIAVVTLGARRPFMYRPTGGGPSTKVLPGHGDLLVMGGSFQRTWEHAVPKVSEPLGPRISLQFRALGVR